MGAFVLLVPALLVVVAGYAVAYVVAEALGVTAPEAVAWPGGLLLLVVTCWALWRRRRRRARGLGAGARGRAR
ncbi:hypothetical protein [Geodermatophilus sp. URMC 62]|uniref:hypothetical protein n=1 Tax=Geodermatophilus sp. URMC 62 TaxID=3423414 RepID=UPI00406C76CB